MAPEANTRRWQRVGGYLVGLVDERLWTARGTGLRTYIQGNDQQEANLSAGIQELQTLPGVMQLTYHEGTLELTLERSANLAMQHEVMTKTTMWIAEQGIPRDRRCHRCGRVRSSIIILDDKVAVWQCPICTDGRKYSPILLAAAGVMFLAGFAWPILRTVIELVSQHGLTWQAVSWPVWPVSAGLLLAGGVLMTVGLVRKRKEKK